MPLKVRLLTPDDMPALERLYRRDPLRFLTPRMNLEVYGFGGDVVQAWGAFTPDETEIEGMLLRYSNTVIVADLDGVAASALAPIIDDENRVAGVRGTMETVRRVRAHLRRYTANGMEQSTFMQSANAAPLPARNPETRPPRPPGRPGHAGDAVFRRVYHVSYARQVAAKLAETRVFVVEEPQGARQPLRIAVLRPAQHGGSRRGLDRRRVHECGRAGARDMPPPAPPPCPSICSATANCPVCSTKIPWQAAFTAVWALKRRGNGP